MLQTKYRTNVVTFSTFKYLSDITVWQILLKAQHAFNTSVPLCLIAGGETTVNLTGQGKGGPNLEMALSAGIHMAKCHNLYKERRAKAFVFLLCAGKFHSDIWFIIIIIIFVSLSLTACICYRLKVAKWNHNIRVKNQK